MAGDTISLSALDGTSAVATLSQWGVTYAITGGADQALFNLADDGGLRRLSFVSRPDIASPQDTGGDNVYEVEVTATAGGVSAATLYRIAVVADDVRGDATTTATIPTDGVAVSGRIDLPNDADWFAFASTGGRYLVQTRGAAGGFSIRKADGSSYFSFFGGSPAFQPLDLPAGDYFLVVGPGAEGGYVASVAKASSGPVGTSGAGDDILNGSDLADILFGGAGDDVINGRGGADVISDGAGNDVVNAGAGDDLILAGPGDDLIDGGGGYDVVRFSGARASYAITSTADAWRVSGPDGTDTIANVQAFEFADQLARPVSEFGAGPTGDVVVPDPAPAANQLALTALSGTAAVTAFFQSGVAYAITGGADQALFSLADDGVSPDLKRLSFVARPDIATPQDAGGDNVYEVEITATAGGVSTTTLHRITVVADDARGDITTTATIPTDGKVFQGRFDAEQDSDWFGFTSTGGDYLFLSHPVHAFSIMTADGSLWHSSFGLGLNWQTLDLPAGDYYLAVTGGEAGDYFLTVAKAGRPIAAGPGSGVVNGTNLAEIIHGGLGDDTIDAGGGADVIDAGSGNDTINAGDGDDFIFYTAGDDVIDGGAGYDVVRFAGPRASYAITSTAAEWRVSGPDGAAVIRNVQAFEFQDQAARPVGEFGSGPSTDVSPSQPGPSPEPAPPSPEPPAPPAPVTGLSIDAVPDAVTALLRGSAGTGAASVIAASISNRLAVGRLTPQAALEEILQAADATISVATMSYQFFTGRIPTEAGVDYLVAEGGGNPNNLNSAYYQHFNIENRYINFAVNLGKMGEGRAAFEAAYGDKSFFEATRTAYATIFGGTPSDEKVQALIEGRQAYFAYYGQDGTDGVGTKAAMIGWLLAEAAKSNIGTYALANDAFLIDLIDGATFEVSLIGAYARPEYAFDG